MLSKSQAVATLACTAIAAAIAACGGGGGGGGTSLPPPPPSSSTPTPTPTPTPTATPTPPPSPSPTGAAATTIYVVDADAAGDNSFNGALYTVPVPSTTGTAFAPTRTIVGGSTLLVNPQYVALASNGDAYVTTPGTGLSHVGSLLRFAAGTPGGNATPSPAPSDATYTSLAEGVAIDGSNNIWIVSQSHVAKFGPAPTSLSAPLQDITGSSINDDYGIALGPSGAIYVAGSQYVDRFPSNATGAPTPNQITGSMTKIASVLAVAVDSFGRVFAGNQSAYTGEAGPSVTVYAAGEPSIASSNVAPVLIITPPTATFPNARPRGLAIDGQNNLFIADYGDGAILVYKPPYTSLSASIIGLHKPVGIAVR